jgi:5-methylcytosine-specific restriction endonuclease McrA
VDHIIDWQDAPHLAFDMANLRATCRSCNSAQRNARVAARARAQRRLSASRAARGYREW